MKEKKWMKNGVLLNCISDKVNVKILVLAGITSRKIKKKNLKCQLGEKSNKNFQT